VRRKYIIIFSILLLIVILLSIFIISGILKRSKEIKVIDEKISESSKKEIENISRIFVELLCNYDINYYIDDYYENLKYFTNFDVKDKENLIFNEFEEGYKKYIVEDDWGWFQRSRVYNIEFKNIKKYDKNYSSEVLVQRAYEDPNLAINCGDIITINFIKENNRFYIEDFTLKEIKEK